MANNILNFAQRYFIRGGWEKSRKIFNIILFSCNSVTEHNSTNELADPEYSLFTIALDVTVIRSCYTLLERLLRCVMWLMRKPPTFHSPWPTKRYHSYTKVILKLKLVHLFSWSNYTDSIMHQVLHKFYVMHCAVSVNDLEPITTYFWR